MDEIGNVMEKPVKLVLDWHRGDIEQRCGFRGGKYTDVNMWLVSLVALLMTGWFYLVIFLLRPRFPEARFIKLVLERGWTPHAMVVLFFLSLVVLFVKSRKLAFQRRAFEVEIVPPGSGFALTSDSALDALARLNALVDDPSRFVLFNRVCRALQNLKNVGNLSDVSEMLRAQAENDENQVDSSYGLLAGSVWTLPILGFIGTVIGLSGAIGGFGQVLNSDATVENLREGLTPVTANLGIAFDTTFLALVLALIVQVLSTLMRRKEEAFLDRCRDWAHENVISRLRLTERKE